MFQKSRKLAEQQQRAWATLLALLLVAVFWSHITPPAHAQSLPALQENSSNHPSSASTASVHPAPALPPGVTGDYFNRQKKIYRWSDQTRFVLVYIATSAFLPDWQPWHIRLMKDAFADWQAALHNRLMFVFMNEPSQADVIVSWWNQSQPGIESGASGLNRVKTWGRYICENDIYLSLHNDGGRPWSPAEMYPFALHEIGHMLGIQEHSNNSGDIMAPVVGSNMHITPRDIATLQRIYTVRADYTNPPGVHISQFSIAQTPRRFRVP